MPALPQSQHTTARRIYEHYEKRQAAEPMRGHLGASQIGEPCMRRLWLAFRWTERPTFDGRTLRLFDTGKREEARVHAELRAIGCEVWADDGSGQFSYTACDGHFGGSLDGVVAGLPEAPKTPHVVEIKTHNAKSFADLAKRGVASSKPAHYAQMQCYMALADLDAALYFAVAKDTDELHIERVKRDREFGERMIAKASVIIRAPEPPARISADPAWHECKYCPFHSHCHGDAAPQPTCRSCIHSTPAARGTWTCEHWQADIPLDAQAAGCDEHRYIPALLERFAEVTDAKNDGAPVIFYRNRKTGQAFSQPQYKSREIREAIDKSVLGDAMSVALKDEFPGTEVVSTTYLADMADDLPWEEEKAA